MAAMKRFAGVINTVVEAAHGKRVQLHMAVYAPQYRKRRLPKPPPPPLPPDLRAMIKASAEGKL
jgi:hypothetical protein